MIKHSLKSKPHSIGARTVKNQGSPTHSRQQAHLCAQEELALYLEEQQAEREELEESWEETLRREAGPEILRAMS